MSAPQSEYTPVEALPELGAADLHPDLDLPLRRDLIHPDRQSWSPRQLREITNLVASELTAPLLDVLRIDEQQRWWAKIGLTAGLPLFVDTESALVARDLSMGSSSTNTVGAVAGVLRITDQYGPGTLERTLKVAEDAWGRTKDTWDGMLLGGIGMFLGRHGDHVDDQVLAEKIGKKGPAFRWRANITTLASAGGTQHSGTGSRVSTCYQLILTEWNKGRRAENRIAV